MQFFVRAFLTSSALWLVSCGGPQDNTVDVPGVQMSAPSSGATSAILVNNPRPGFASSVGGNFTSFEQWKQAFHQRAISSGIREDVYASAAPYMQFHAQTVSSDRNQAEFKETVMDYVEKRVSPKRVSLGHDKMAQYGPQIRAIAQAYQVDESVLVGIWGMETNYGTYTGNDNVFRSMSTLAYEGRRREFAETQLLNALLIVQNGDRPASELNGSWGSGLGHTQFIPEMYNIYAVDWNRDGRRNVWDPLEAIASTANYLRNEGWTPGLPWGGEVILPAGFSGGGIENFQSPEYWQSMGVQSKTARGLPNAPIAIYIPEGSNGRAFAVTRNFKTIKRYNNSTAYALAVGVLGDVTNGYAPR